MPLTLSVVALLVSVMAAAVAASALRRTAARSTQDELEAVPEDLLGLRQEVAALRGEMRSALRHLAVVRYDAFADSGGHLSWSVALLDDLGDGVVLTSIHGRNQARSYTKNVSGWSGDQLSPEETLAIERAHP